MLSINRTSSRWFLEEDPSIDGYFRFVVISRMEYSTIRTVDWWDSSTYNVSNELKPRCLRKRVLQTPLWKDRQFLNSGALTIINKIGVSHIISQTGELKERPTNPEHHSAYDWLRRSRDGEIVKRVPPIEFSNWLHHWHQQIFFPLPMTVVFQCLPFALDGCHQWCIMLDSRQSDATALIDWLIVPKPMLFSLFAF